jgi:uncharacterized membrane protein
MSVQESVRAAGSRSIRSLEVAFWIVLAFYLALVVGFALSPTLLAQFLAAVGILAACLHAVLSYGWKDALALLAICVVIAFAVENIGVATGLPFGRYHFEVGSELPHVGAIPIIVGPLWFGMGYFFVDRGYHVAWRRAAAVEPDRRTRGIANGRRIRDDAMGCGDRPP